MKRKHDPDYDRGTVRYLASELEIPPHLAVAGGDHAAAAMAELKKAHIAGSGGMRQNHVAEAQKHIAAIDPQRHGELLQHLQSVAVTLGGKPHLAKLAHVTPGEIVVPRELRTPELITALQATAEAQGIDLSRYLIGSRDNSINPQTGQPEFYDPQQPRVPKGEPTGGQWTLEQLPQSGSDRGYYNYGTPLGGKGQYARPEIIKIIKEVGRKWKESGNPPFGVGNMSKEHGGPFDNHSATGGHSDGSAVDVRPIRKDGQQGKVTWQSPDYDREATQRLVDGLRSTGKVERILFNDPNIRGVTPSDEKHDNHLHVQFKR